MLTKELKERADYLEKKIKELESYGYADSIIIARLEISFEILYGIREGKHKNGKNSSRNC